MSAAGLSVRPATVADVASLVPLINRAYRVEDFFVRGKRLVHAAEEHCRAVQHGTVPSP